MLPPSGVSPLPSATSQAPCIVRALSRISVVIGGWSGPMEHSPVTDHSPASCSSHRCWSVNSTFIAASFRLDIR
ncbi:hypothetical protein STAQ_14150 [Allostella sp. ATCC 35155]|nr:hypothetical protein STAQ_14150 [Stella sp. ATCC 35155]